MIQKIYSFKYVLKKHDDSHAIFQEFLKLTVDLVDLFGLHFIIQRVSGKSQVKVSTEQPLTELYKVETRYKVAICPRGKLLNLWIY